MGRRLDRLRGPGLSRGLPGWQGRVVNVVFRDGKVFQGTLTALTDTEFILTDGLRRPHRWLLADVEEFLYDRPAGW